MSCRLRVLQDTQCSFALPFCSRYHQTWDSRTPALRRYYLHSTRHPLELLGGLELTYGGSVGWALSNRVLGDAKGPVRRVLGKEETSSEAAGWSRGPAALQNILPL